MIEKAAVESLGFTSAFTIGKEGHNRTHKLISQSSTRPHRCLLRGRLCLRLLVPRRTRHWNPICQRHFPTVRFRSSPNTKLYTRPKRHRLQNTSDVLPVSFEIKRPNPRQSAKRILRPQRWTLRLLLRPFQIPRNLHNPEPTRRF